MTIALVAPLLDVDFAAAPLALLCAYLQGLRRYLVPLATLLFLILHGFFVDVSTIREVLRQEGLAERIHLAWFFPGMLPLAFAAIWLLLACWRRLALAPPRRSTLYLVLALLTLAAAAETPAAAGLPRIILWSLLLIVEPYAWFLAYALAGVGVGARPPAWRHLGVFHPFWGSSTTPFGKGLAYLSRYEARTSEELAVTQLKGLKLALWILLLAACLQGCEGVLRDIAALPTFDQLFLDYLGGARPPRSLCWASLLAFFVTDMLKMTIWGGAIVACARLAGFRLLRNTYRPMQARTLAEFWNRYYFYYKELLVDHFFYPTFLTCFRRHRKLRVFFATFMAACVGNLLFHFLRDIRFVAQLGWRQAIGGEASHAFYTLLLALGVGLSQMRERPRGQDRGFFFGQVMPGAWVVLFFCVLHVFDAPLDRVHTIGQRACFLLYLMGFDAWT